MTISAAPPRQGEPLSGETRLMLRAAQLYYRLNLTQDEVGKRLGVSRFKVGRLLDRALRESAVRIEIVHPAARLVALEDALVERFGLRGAIVVDVPATGSRGRRRAPRPRARRRRGRGRHLAALRPTGAIGVSWGRTMLELAAHLRPGWTSATEIVQLNGAISRSAQPDPRPGGRRALRDHDAAPPSASWPRPAIVGTAELRRALEADPSVGETLAAARRAPTAVFGMGVLGPDSVHVASGYLDDADLAALAARRRGGRRAGSLPRPRRPHRPPRRSTGARSACRWSELRAKPLTVGRRGRRRARPDRAGRPARGAVRHRLVADEPTADWVLAHG